MPIRSYMYIRGGRVVVEAVWLIFEFENVLLENHNVEDFSSSYQTIILVWYDEELKHHILLLLVNKIQQLISESARLNTLAYLLYMCTGVSMYTLNYEYFEAIADLLLLISEMGLPADYTCSYCCDAITSMKDPRQLTCGDVFCFECIKNDLQLDGRIICVACRWMGKFVLLYSNEGWAPVFR